MTVLIDDSISSRATAIETANASGDLVDLGGQDIQLDRTAYLTRAPRLINGTITSDGSSALVMSDPGQAAKDSIVQFVDVTITGTGGSGVWTHRNWSFDRLEIDGLRVSGVERIQLDGVFKNGGFVVGLKVQNLVSENGNCFGVSLGFNNTKNQDFPPIIMRDVWIDGIETKIAAEAHGIISIAQPIHVSGGYIANVIGVGNDGSEGVYTKSSRNIISGVCFFNAGNGEGVIAIKGGFGSDGSVVSHNIIRRSPGSLVPKSAIIIHSDFAMVSQNVIQNYGQAQHGDVWVTAGHTGTFIGCGQVFI